MAVYLNAAMPYGKMRINPGSPGAGGASTTLDTIPEGASQSFKKGSLLKASGGKAIVGTVSSGATVGNIGIAAANATGTASTAIPYYPIADQEFTACVNGSASTAALYTLKATDVGLDYGLAHSTTTKVWYVNKSVTSASKAVVVVQRLVDAASTVNGRCVVRFRRNVGNVY